MFSFQEGAPLVSTPHLTLEKGAIWAFRFPERLPELGQELLKAPPGELFGQDRAKRVPGFSPLPKLCLPQVLTQSLSPLGSELVRTQVRAQPG